MSTTGKETVAPGAFKRAVTEFRDRIAADGTSFPPVDGRYVLVVANACPWCHRVLIMLHLKGIAHLFTINVASFMGAEL